MQTSIWREQKHLNRKAYFDALRDARKDNWTRVQSGINPWTPKTWDELRTTQRKGDANA